MIDKLKELFTEKPKGSAPEHLDGNGPKLGWSASDLADDELVDDEWIRANTKEV